MKKPILEHFKRVDTTLYNAALKSTKKIQLTKSNNYFASLCESIISQQLSVKVGDVIYDRFKALVRNEVTPENVMQLTVEKIRSIGASQAKGKYILDLATKVHEKEVHLASLEKMTDQGVVDELTKVKGIGPWTAEMFLMFSLCREDLFSTGDLGLKRAIEKLYKLEDPTPEKLLEISSKWKPYRTYACRILWNSLDNTPQ